MGQVLKLGGKNLNSENWKVYHPNGKHMFTCAEKKANWYLDNRDSKTGEKLAKIIGDYEIQLTFSPKGSGYKKGEVFGLSGREMRCVVNGEIDGLQRHHIVPYCYRSHFPTEYKSKNHHDVVLITHKYHEEYEKKATKFKNELAHIYGVKTLNECNVKYTKLLSNFSNSNIKNVSLLHSLFTSYGKMPQETINKYLYYVADNIGISRDQISKYNYIQLYKLYTILKDEYDKKFEELKNSNKDEYDHGYHVVKQLKTHEDIEVFVRIWRKHFIETMKPKYMPDGWSVDFKIKVEI